MPDFSTARNPMLNHLAELASATDLPLSADLEDGFGAMPEDVAATVQLAAAAGVVGASVADHSGFTAAPLTEPARAVDRIRAAAELQTAGTLGFAEKAIPGSTLNRMFGDWRQ